VSTAIVTEDEFRRNLDGLLRRVREGAEVVVEAPGQQPVRLSPAAPPVAKGRRQPGTMRGVFRISADFDETPIEVLESIDAPLDPAAR